MGYDKEEKEMRGPGQTRRFNQRDFTLSEVFAGTIDKQITAEERESMARRKARILRQNGLYARIVNGSGWTAIYIGQQTPGMPMIQIPPSNNPKMPVFEPPVVVGRKKGRFDNIETTLSGFDWGKETGIEPIKPKFVKEPPIEPIVYEPNTIQASVIANLVKKRGSTTLSQNGLAEFPNKIDKTKTNFWASINDARVVEGKELANLLSTFTVAESKVAIARLLDSIKTDPIGATYQTGEKRQKLNRLFDIFTGRKKPSVENLGGAKLYVVYSNDDPLYFSFNDGTFASYMENQEKEARDRRKKEKDNFPGWSKFKGGVNV
tara:strand:+ start:11711 stop:12670 length:960 start_codon:yes stop_codon:yes gene_type:complete